MRNKLTTKQRAKELKRIGAILDDQIDTCDIPELTDEQLHRAVMGRMWRA